MVFRFGKGLTEAERATVCREISVIDARMGRIIPPNDETVIRDVANQLFASFKAKKAREDEGGRDEEDGVYDGFLLALTGRSEAAVRQAVLRLLRNQAPKRFSRVYVPTAAEFTEFVMDIEAEWSLERKRLTWLLDRGEVAPPDAEAAGFSKERMAALRAMNERLTAAATKPIVPSQLSAAGRVAADIARRKAEHKAPEDRT